MSQHLRLEIARPRRAHYGQSSERRARLLDRLERQLEELEAAAADGIAAAKAAAKTATVQAFERHRPSRQPFPERLPRERVAVAAPTSCVLGLRSPGEDGRG